MLPYFRAYNGRAIFAYLCRCQWEKLWLGNQVKVLQFYSQSEIYCSDFLQH
jgi:hypothetical protein